MGKKHCLPSVKNSTTEEDSIFIRRAFSYKKTKNSFFDENNEKPSKNIYENIKFSKINKKTWRLSYTFLN